jgi:hypothetical protein
VGLSLFWAAADYSAAVGRSRAAQFVRELPSHPEAIVYSEHSLNMRAQGVGVVHCRDPEAAYGYRYDGLALVLQSNDQYVLLPKDWSPGDGVAMVLPRNDSVRLEFMRAGAAASVPPADERPLDGFSPARRVRHHGDAAASPTRQLPAVAPSLGRDQLTGRGNRPASQPAGTSEVMGFGIGPSRHGGE